MKIVVYAGEGGSGGLKGYIKGELSACHVDESFQITVICTESFANYIKDSISANVKLLINNASSTKLLSLIKGNKIPDSVLKLIHDEAPDLVYFPNSIIHRGAEKYINVLSMHNQLYIDTKQLNRQRIGKTLLSLYISRHIALRSMKRASAVIFDSKNSMEQSQKKKIRFKKAIISYFGVEDSERVKQARVKVINSPVELLYVSTILPYKNQIPLINGIAELKKRGYSLKLHLVGSGHKKFKKDLIKSVSKHKLENEIVLYDWVEHKEIKKMIDDSDIFIYASSIETSGFGLMEGMVRGASIVCNNESCMPEILGDGGLLFDVHDPIDVADTLQRLIDDQALRNELSLKAMGKSASYTWENHMKRVFACFKELNQSKG